MGVLAQTCKKKKKKEDKVGNEKSRVGMLLTNSRKICRHFVFLVHRKKFLNVMFKGVDESS